MENDDLRKQADELEARLIVYVREAFEDGGDECASDAMLLSTEVLEADRYRVEGKGEREDGGDRPAD